MKVYGNWKVAIPGEEYPWSPDDWRLSVWAQIETDLGMTSAEFARAVAVRKAATCQWLVWYLRKQTGVDEELAAVDFPLMQMTIEEVPDEGEAPAADTPPSESVTSSPSSNDSESAPATGTT